MEDKTSEMLISFKEESKPYFLDYPFMAPGPGLELDGNGILYAGTYGLLAHKLFGEYDNAAEHSTLLYKKSYLKDQPGVITKGPHKWEDPQTHDDYIGLCTLSFLNHGGAANAINNHGVNSGWVYRHGSWFNSLFWRLPGVVQHIKLCAGVNWNPLDKVLFSIGLIADTFGRQDDTSGKILKWHYVCAWEISGRRHWFCDYAVRRWKRKLIETYPNAMGGVFSIYYGAHILTKWANGII